MDYLRDVRGVGLVSALVSVFVVPNWLGCTVPLFRM